MLRQMDRLDVHMVLVTVHELVVRLVIARLPGAHKRHIEMVRHLVLYVTMEPMIAVRVMGHSSGMRLGVALLCWGGLLSLSWLLRFG